jgi:hypothetical protein
MANDHARQRADLYDAAVVISDLHVTEPEQLTGLLQLIRAETISQTAVVVAELSDKAAGFIQYANSRSANTHIVAVKLADLAVGDAVTNKLRLKTSRC